MPATYIVENGTVTIRFEWPGVPIPKAQEIVNCIARYEHNHGHGPVDEEGSQIPFEELTTIQKLHMTFLATQRGLAQTAATCYINDKVSEIREEATRYAWENLNLDLGET